jgi:hypothetical protein
MIHRRELLKLAAGTAISAAVMGAIPESVFAAVQVNTTVYWGALVHGETYGINPATGKAYGNPPWDFSTLDLFEKHAGKKGSIVHWGQPWYWSTQWPNGYYPFVPSIMNAVRSRGCIPMIDWASWDLSANGSPSQTRFSLASIIRGDHDAYIRKFAADAKAWGFPFFLRFDWEMNGDWYPWSEKKNGNSAGQYVQAWRHVHDIFTAAGANNVTWVWCPNIDAAGEIPLAGLYPGDAYVDWTGLDAYNKDPKYWASFNTVMTGAGTTWIHNSYQQLMALAPRKPIMLAESASLEAGDGGAKKAAWIRDALTTQIPAKFPNIKAVLWFNWNCDPGSTYTIETTSAAQSAFASGIAAPTYSTNKFGALAAGQKVRPLA